MNLQAPSRIVRATSKWNCLVSAPIYNATSSSGAFSNSRVNVQFLTPSLDVPLPPKSVVPYLEFPRYITQYQGGAIPSGSTAQIVSQTITLPQIPDLLLIYVKPNAASLDPTQADWYFPIASTADNVNAPLQVNFDNFSGLLSSQTAEQLYAMSVKNGLDMDYNAWIGEAHVGGAGAVGTLGGSSQNFGGASAGRVPLVGGMLVLKPSQDITLQTGQAPSLVGNFTLQLNLTVKNTSGVAQSGVQMYIVTVNSGFFESIRGSSRIIKGVLSEQDVISAPLAPQGTRDMLSRYVGAGIFSTVANALSKAKDIYHASKPLGQAVKGMLPEGTAKDMMGKVGYGVGAGTGGVGAGTGGRRRKADERCM